MGQKPLVRKCIQMKRLLAVFRSAANISTNLELKHWVLPSSWITAQLRLRIGQKITGLEVEILTELDYLLFGTDGLGKRNPLASWVCLWILILAYREHMSHLWHRHINGVIWSRVTFYLASHVYDTLTSIYSALYKTTSPLTFDWRTDEISEMLGRDQDLIKAFCSIKTEMYWFRMCSTSLF